MSRIVDSHFRSGDAFVVLDLVQQPPGGRQVRQRWQVGALGRARRLPARRLSRKAGGAGGGR